MYIGSYNKQPIYFEKKIIIKDDNLESLEGRITELLRFEDTKRVIFGVFNLSEDASKITQMFQTKLLLVKLHQQELVGGYKYYKYNGRLFCKFYIFHKNNNC